MGMNTTTVQVLTHIQAGCMILTFARAYLRRDPKNLISCPLAGRQEPQARVPLVCVTSLTSDCAPDCQTSVGRQNTATHNGLRSLGVVALLEP